MTDALAVIGTIILIVGVIAFIKAQAEWISNPVWDELKEMDKAINAKKLRDSKNGNS